MKTKNKSIKISCGTPFQWIDDLWKDYIRPEEWEKPFDLMVLVSGRIDSPGPRDGKWEYILDIGSQKISSVLERKGIGRGPHYFIFPDRWMNPPESYLFIKSLSHNPDIKLFDKVYIVTNQPYIVGGPFKRTV